MKYIAVLDHEHLDNALFLTAFAKSLSAHKDRQGIIVHGGSEYTERLIQTGMMREDAEIRAIKDLNRRLIALFADHGISTIGMNSYQKEMILRTENQVVVNKSLIDQLPETPFLLLSSLVKDDNGNVFNLSLSDLTKAIEKTFDDHEIVLFSMDDRDEIIQGKGRVKSLTNLDLDESFKTRYLPKEFHEFQQDFILTTPSDFSLWPKLMNETRIVSTT